MTIHHIQIRMRVPPVTRPVVLVPFCTFWLLSGTVHRERAVSFAIESTGFEPETPRQKTKPWRFDFWILPVRPMTPTWFWGSKTGPTETTLADGREWKYIHNMSISQSNSWLLCSILLLPVSLPLWSALFRYKWWIVWTKGGLYIQCISAHFNPAKVCGSVLVWNTCTTCIFLRRLHRSTSDGLLMVAQKDALNIHCILARFIHIWDQHVHAPELYCLTFGAEPACGLGQSATADQPWMAHGGNFPRTSKCPFPRTSKWAMSKDLWIEISGNFH